MIELGYSRLLNEADNHVYIYEDSLHPKVKGLQADNVIWLNKSLSEHEKYCVLAEELGHYFTSYGDITDQSKLTNRKQEKRARSWAYKKAIPLNKFIEAHKNLISSKFELAEFLSVTEDFLEDALDRYIEKYGVCVEYKNYIIRFDPLGVTEIF